MGSNQEWGESALKRLVLICGASIQSPWVIISSPMGWGVTIKFSMFILRIFLQKKAFFQIFYANSCIRQYHDETSLIHGLNNSTIKIYIGFYFEIASLRDSLIQNRLNFHRLVVENLVGSNLERIG